MGQHKTNQTAIDAKEGKLKPKKRKPGAAETRRNIQAEIYRRLGLNFNRRGRY